MLRHTSRVLSRRVGVDGVRRMSAYSGKLGEWQAKADELLKIPNFPDTLKPWFSSIGPAKAEFDEFEAKYPEIVKSIEAKVLEVRKAGIPEDARLEGVDPESDKYMLLKILYEGDYITDKIKEAGLATYTLTAADKEQLKSEMQAAAVAKGIDPSLVGKDIPDTVDLL